MFRRYRRQTLLISLFYVHGGLFADTQNLSEPVCHSNLHLLYQTYDEKSRQPLKLSYDPATMGLCLQTMGSAIDEFSHSIALPEPVISIDVAVTTGQQIILAGKSQDNSSFLQAMDDTGTLLWRYPSSAQTNNHHLQFYDLTLSKNKTVLFAAGSADGQSMLWRFSLSDSGISHTEEIRATGNSAVAGSYRQVITESGNEAIVVRYPDQNDLPTKLEKWYRQHDQWQPVPDFCPQLSLNNVVSTALKTEQSGKRFFFIAAQPGQIRFYQIDMLTGNLLNQLTADSLLHWDYTARVTTPALLSASAALKQESTDQTSVFQDQIAHLNHDLASRPVVVLTNRGCLLGVSSTLARGVPLVINLCPVREYQKDKLRSTSPEEADLWDAVPDFSFIVRSVLMASGVLGLSVLGMKGFQLYSSWSARQAQLPEETPNEKLRRQRLEHLAKNPALSESLTAPKSQSRLLAPSGELLLQDISRKDKQTPSDKEQEKSLQLLLLGATSDKAEHKEENTGKITITRKMLSEALEKVMPSKASAPEKSGFNKTPGSLILRPMPADHLCFYHAIGQAVELSGEDLLNFIVTQAQALLQNASACPEHIINIVGSDILSEIAAIAHVDAADTQVWGHEQMLPFICSLLKLSVAVVTPATWHNEAGGLLFQPDGNWEMLYGNAESLLAQLKELRSASPNLVIIQYNGYDHWDALEWGDEGN